jgi:signal transduction histidine kinase
MPFAAATVLSSHRLRSLAQRNGDKVKDEILAIVAHELCGPSAPLRLAAEVIRRASPQRTDVLRMVGTIKRQIEGIARLADDLMDATRTGRGSLRLCKGEVDLSIACPIHSPPPPWRLQRVARPSPCRFLTAITHQV